MAEDLKWGWTLPGEENAHGPYDTREEAIEAARKRHPIRVDQKPPEVEIEVGRCEPTTVEDHMPGPEDILDAINQHAYDNGFSWLDEGVFDFKEGSEDVFFAGLEMLVKQHIVSNGAWLLVDTEKVRLI